MSVLNRNRRILADRDAGQSYSDLQAKYNLPQSSLRRIVSETRRIAVSVSPTEIISRLENQDTDFDKWESAYKRLTATKTFIRVMHLSDIHFPFHDKPALTLTYEIVRLVQPDVIVVGSDAFDLPTISRFEPDRDLNVDDWLQHIQGYWKEFIHELRQRAPAALMPFIVGNHDSRALSEIKKLSVPKTVMSHFIDMVRSDGDVFWLGDTSEIEIGNLTVSYGWKSTRHAAAATLQAFQYQRNIIVGHTHRPDFYTVRGSAYSVACMVGGCLCQLTPHYQQGRKHTDWQHGTVLATVDTRGNNSHLQNLIYHNEGNRIWTVVNGQVIHHP